jgi:hypothetical protein
MQTGIYVNNKTMEMIQVYIDNDSVSEFYAAFTPQFHCVCGCINCTYRGTPLTWREIDIIKRVYTYLGVL